MTQQNDHGNERVLELREVMRNGEDDGANTKPMESDQYQHFIPRFILRKFAQPGLRNVMVWDSWRNQIHMREIKNTFGMFNQYDSADNENVDNKYVENRFADLECDMGAILKKVESALASENEHTKTHAGIQLLESEVHTVYKFIGLAGIRNGPFGLSIGFGETEVLQERYRQDWVKTLKVLLNTPHKELVETDELLQPETFRLIFARYKQLAMMKLFFWTTSVGEEFLLSNFSVGLEGYQYPRVGMPGVAAHVFLPMGPKTLLVLCSDPLCKKSMLYDAPHGVVTPYDRPARGKLGKTEGPKKYQPIVPGWKTTYTITQISPNNLQVINGLILGLGRVVVYKSPATLEKAIDNIILFNQRCTAWRTANNYSSVKVKEEDKVISEIGMLFAEAKQIIGSRLNQICKEELREITEKLIMYNVFDPDQPLHFVPALCGSTAYYMGAGKGKSKQSTE